MGNVFLFGLVGVSMQNIPCCRATWTFTAVLPLRLLSFECALELQKGTVKAFRIKAKKIGGNLQPSGFFLPIADFFFKLVLLEGVFLVKLQPSRQ